MRRTARLVEAALALAIVLSQGIPGLELTAGLGPASAGAAVHLEPVVAGLASPVYATSARDGTGRLFVVEQAGVIKVVPPGSTAAGVFLDIRSKVESGSTEQGLLGLAFHPDFASNRRFFVHYTRRGDGAIVIAEYRASPTDPNAADPAETPVLTVPDPFSNHNGGMIEFGPDGYLYIALGDGGSANDPGNRAQDLAELLGKILRIDVDGASPYASPPTNPFVGVPGARPEIYAYGFRNPWRFSFDALTGELYVGDVGQSTREEIDLVIAGGNYGWRIREGSICTPNDPALCGRSDLLPPILDYAHTAGRCSVTGGYVYRGHRGTLPSGTYVFADYCTGEIWQYAGAGQDLLLDAGFRISSFGEDESGEILVVDHGGAIYRLSSGPEGCLVDLNPSEASLSARATTGLVLVRAAQGCAWSVSTDAEWIHPSRTGGTGFGVVRYRADANPSSAARVGTLVIEGHAVTVRQAASPRACAPVLNPRSAVVPRTGGAGSVSVSIGADCNWTATSNAPWITVTGGTGTGSGTVTYTVAPGSGVRSGSIAIGGRTFRVFSF